MGYYVTFDGGSGTGKGTIISWCERYLISHEKRVLVLKDNILDPFREYGVWILNWCRANKVDHQSFLLPLFVAGRAAIEEKLKDALSGYDIVLRDRSFISTLAYQTYSDNFSPDQIWDLCINYMHMKVPDLAVIIDSSVSSSIERITLRDRRDVGMGGKMSSSKKQRFQIRRRFLELPKMFDDRMRMLLVSNKGTYTEDREILEKRMERVCGPIVTFLLGELSDDSST